MKRARRALTGLDDDIRDHSERETQDNIERGMTPNEARKRDPVVPLRHRACGPDRIRHSAWSSCSRRSSGVLPACEARGRSRSSLGASSRMIFQ
jgi:hypothetical protein